MPTSPTITRILFVDDDELVLSALRRVLRDEPWVSSFMTDVEGVCDVIVNGDIDVVVTDHNMPQMTGIDLLLRVRERAPRVVRVMLTGQSRNDGHLAFREDGLVQHLLMKPWDNVALKQFLRGLVDGLHSTTRLIARTG